MRAAVLWALVLLVAVVSGALALGPREPVDLEIAFDPASLPEDLDTYLAEAEALVPALRPEEARRIVWAGEAGARTALSIVYLHGFSASSEEIRPVPDRLAEALGANLYFARLRGHGQDGAAMAEPTVGDWLEDTAESLAIGRRIGERVVVLATSTGGSLAAIAAADPALSEGIAGVALVSPNFAVNRPEAALLTLPWARLWLPRVAGEERGFAPVNEAHGRHWTTRYPIEAVLPMAALVAHARGLDHGQVRVPALFLYSEHDEVVSPAATRRVFEQWGGPKRIEPVVVGPGDDPVSHVIAGDILSPGQTQATVALLLDWVQGL